VTALVHRAVEAHGKVTLVPPGGDAHIAAAAVLWGRYVDDVRVVGKNAADTVLVRGIDKPSAARVKAIVDRRAGGLRAA